MAAMAIPKMAKLKSQLTKAEALKARLETETADLESINLDQLKADIDVEVEANYEKKAEELSKACKANEREIYGSDYESDHSIDGHQNSLALKKLRISSKIKKGKLVIEKVRVVAEGVKSQIISIMNVASQLLDAYDQVLDEKKFPVAVVLNLPAVVPQPTVAAANDSDIPNLQTQLNEAKEEIKLLKQGNKSLQADLERIRVTSSDKDVQASVLTARIKNLETGVCGLKKEKDDIGAQLTLKTSELSIATEKVKILSSKITGMTPCYEKGVRVVFGRYENVKIVRIGGEWQFRGDPHRAIINERNAAVHHGDIIADVSVWINGEIKSQQRFNEFRKNFHLQYACNPTEISPNPSVWHVRNLHATMINCSFNTKWTPSPALDKRFLELFNSVMALPDKALLELESNSLTKSKVVEMESITNQYIRFQKARLRE